MAGLMIETHVNPDVALSDAKQQVTPAKLTSILDEIIWRHAEAEDKNFDKKLDSLRGDIDELDSQLIEVIAQRMNLVDDIAELKKDNDVTILQVSRYQEMLEDRLDKAEKLKVRPEFIKLIFEQIHQNSIKRQEGIMNPTEV
jgi:chorismate mutase